MKRNALLIAALALAALCTGGCATQQSALRNHDVVALTTLGPALSADPSGPQQPDVFRLGAGDALGQAIFANYVAYVRANPNWQYAGAEPTN